VLSLVPIGYEEKLVPGPEVESRIGRLCQEMKGHGLEAVLIWSRPDRFYFSGTSQSSILYVSLHDGPLLLVRRDLDRARAESPLSKILPFPSMRDLPDVIRRHAGGFPDVVGAELDVLPAVEHERLRAALHGVSFRDASPIIRRCRMRKTPFEVEQLRTAARIAREVFEAGLRLLEPGITEIEFAARLEMEAKRRGHEGIVRMRGANLEGYSWHVLSGLSGSIPSEADTPAGGMGLSPAFPMGAGLREIGRNEPILVDFPIVYNGYISDQGRIYSIGELPERLLRAYEACKEIEAEIVRAARPGAQCEEIFMMARELAAEKGYEGGFLGLPGKKAGFVAHGIGLEANEIPVFGVKQRYALEAGVVMAVEPKIVLEGEGVVGIENMYLIGEEGAEKLTVIDDGILEV
jgi:Xaa-Pro dipeptidase